MKDRSIYVFIDLDGKTHYVGQLRSHWHKRRSRASFQYDPTWLKNPLRFPLEPALTLSEQTIHTHSGQALCGAIGDSAPDRWGRILMRRAQEREARKAKVPPRTLSEVDYLLGVNDEARQGALRFTESLNGPFLQLSTAFSIPPLISLPKLLSATEKLLKDKESEEDL